MMLSMQTKISDRAQTVRALAKDENAVDFEPSLQESRTTASVESVPISPNHVQEALKAVNQTILLHLTLERQKLWMNRKMLKTTRVDHKANGCIH
jgi:hypothetical protein